MFTYTFTNTAQFRKFFNIADDMSVVAATDVLKQFFLDSGVDMDVWLSAAGWTVRNEGSTVFDQLFKEIVDGVEKEVDNIA
jgi:hypothetical protein